MADTDRIIWALHKMPEHDPEKGAGERWLFALKNLTKDEAARAVLFLADLQKDRA